MMISLRTPSTGIRLGCYLGIVLLADHPNKGHFYRKNRVIGVTCRPITAQVIPLHEVGGDLKSQVFSTIENDMRFRKFL
ncbi:hypothetical protein [Sphingobacterium suaedae]|uniref:Uncharacterized protein n=1 Tax=Sphingobacterium suaedae TaxID=1686402 RepID=A0ABW5KE76_9SPHI